MYDSELLEELLLVYSQFLSISALLTPCNVDLCLEHVPPVSFARPAWFLPAFLMQAPLSEITEVDKVSQISPLLHEELICWGFIL